MNDNLRSQEESPPTYMLRKYITKEEALKYFPKKFEKEFEWIGSVYMIDYRHEQEQE